MIRNKSFGRLLKASVGSIAACEDKNMPEVEYELGQQIGLTHHSIQRYKAGFVPPDTRTVEMLAEAGVRRGYMNQVWLKRILLAARFPSPDRLIYELYPQEGKQRSSSVRIYHNLPASSYSRFVMRRQAFDEVLDGLGHRSPVVLIVGMSGIGKTSLAREIAEYCLRDESCSARFEAAVWISDKSRPGTVTLSKVLDEICFVLDFPGYAQFEHDLKQREVGQLLRRWPTLVVVDSFDTIRDGALTQWLLGLPEPSKAIVTSRIFPEEFRRSAYIVDLKGMSDSELQELVGQRLRFLRLEERVDDVSQLALLHEIAGGNPAAIEMALGYIKHKHKPIQEVLDDLHNAKGEIFDYLFQDGWNSLDGPSRRILRALPLFPDSIDRHALAVTAGVEPADFERSAERLTHLKILDVQHDHIASMPRYVVHPLVRSFASAKLAERVDFETEARTRWVAWYIQLATKVGYCWDDLRKLKLLDGERDSIHSVIQWCSQHDRYRDVLLIAKGVSYYYYVRGLWNKRPPINLIGAEAAQKLGDPIQEAKFLSYHVQILSAQGDVDEAHKYLPTLLTLEQQLETEALVSGDVFFDLEEAIARYHMARGDLDTASDILVRSLEVTASLSAYARIGNKFWLGVCLHRKGDLDSARDLFSDTLREAVQFGDERAIIACQIQLAAIGLDVCDYEAAEKALRGSLEQADQNRDRRHIAEIHRLYGRLNMLRDDMEAAHSSLSIAYDLFERLGMRHELTQIRHELNQL